MIAMMLVASLIQAAPPAPDVRLYRLMQGGAELARETYRVDGGTIERSIVVPVMNLKIESKAVYNPGWRFQSFETRVMNGAGDTVRVVATLQVSGDSLVATTTRGDSVRRRAVRMHVDGVMPSQSVSVVDEVIRRSGGRDTVFRLLPMGAEATVDVAVRYTPDTVHVTMSGVPAYVLRAQGARASIEIPGQRVSARVWDGRDSLPPLPGMRRPTPDYSAPAGAPYTAQDVSIPIRIGEASFALAGTLTLPRNRPGRVPIVVTISGSGRQTRDEDLWPLLPDYAPFREIADRLGRAGIAVLRYDDRGAGSSGGGEIEATTADYATEVAQIVSWLRARPEIDGRRIALLGHSEGGAIGPLVAADDRGIAALAILAGPGKSGRAIVRDQLRWPVETAVGVPAEERARLLDNTAADVEHWVNMNVWTRWFAAFEPLAVARRITQPALILHGALDRQVSVGQADTLAAAIRAGGNRDVTVRIFPNLNHLFLPTDGDGSPAEYPGLKQHTLPAEVLDALETWLVRKLKP
jgi:alpha-beta hydrolase superfamily lysophospholipase